MVEWIFKPNTSWDRGVHLGVGGFILGALILEVVKNATASASSAAGPSPALTSIVCFAFALILAIPALIRDTPPKAPILGWLNLTLAMAYTWMSLLYFFKWRNICSLPVGYDAATDLVGTLFYAVAWFKVSTNETDHQAQLAERAALAFVCLLAVVFGTTKLVIESPLRGLTADQLAAQLALPHYQAVRLALNVCNGAVFLSLYNQMRRLLAAPDPVTHVLVLLYGCAQIAAHGTDCLSAKNACTSPAIENFVALAIAWTLLLGKIAFGTYASYLYFNGRIRVSGSSPKAVRSTRPPVRLK
jgi:hypothetical protein